MSLESEIKVKLEWDGTRVEAVRVAARRPMAIAELLRLRPPEEALALLPRVFSLCRSAQSAAASRALSSAGANLDIATEDVSPVLLEIVHEYFWRLLIDWPRIARHPIDAATVAEVRRLGASPRRSGDATRIPSPGSLRETGMALAAIAALRILGMPPPAWLAMDDLDALEAWTAAGATLPARLMGALLRDTPNLGRSDVALMPATTREALSRSVLGTMSGDGAFESAPTWEGRPVETGALARMHAHPLVASLVARDGHTVAARMVARIAELAALLEEIAASPGVVGGSSWVDGFRCGTADGVAAVQTARGLLVHRARLERGRIADYRIVAPTEWNFHPDGALARGLRGLAAGDADELERRARLAVQGLDPCVACAIEVGHA